jgi:hypothetical protein
MSSKGNSQWETTVPFERIDHDGMMEAPSLILPNTRISLKYAMGGFRRSVVGRWLVAFSHVEGVQPFAGGTAS